MADRYLDETEFDEPYQVDDLGQKELDTEYRDAQPRHRRARAGQQAASPFREHEYPRSRMTIRSRPGTPPLPFHGSFGDLIGRGRAAMALLMGLLAFVAYNASDHDATESEQQLRTAPQQQISLRAEHDMALGQKSAHRVLLQHGDVTTDHAKQTLIEQIGARLVTQSDAHNSDYRFSFEVLADSINTTAFAMPGGRIYVTAALLDRLTTPGEIAGILAREMAHVTQRHGMARLENAPLSGGHTGAVVMASFLDPVNFQPTTEDVHHFITKTAQLRYDARETQNSDLWAIHYMTQAGFNPNSLITALQRVAGTQDEPTVFAQRHDAPKDQLSAIQRQIAEVFPQGVPSGFTQ